MLEARKYVMVEGTPPFDFVKYVTDMNGKYLTVKITKFLDILKQSYDFRLDKVRDIEEKLKVGYYLLLDLDKKESYRYDDLLDLTPNWKPSNKKDKGLSLDSINKRVEKIVGDKYFKE